MEKKALIFLYGLGILVLSACSAQTKEATFVLDQGHEHMTVQNMYEKERLMKQTVTTILQYKEMGITKTKAKKILDGLGDAYK